VQSIGAFFTSLDIRVRSDQLRKIETFLSHVPERPCKASVIICTYKRTDLLLRALRSVVEQSLPRAEYEIIVVNNDPEDHDLKGVIDPLREEYFKEYPEHFRLMMCPIPGLSHARNSGISVAQGEVLCFLDDDAVAGREWLSQIVSAFDAHPKTGLIGGHIRLVPPDPKPEALLEGWGHFWGNFQTEHSTYTEVQKWWDYPWGGNWCARRQALVEIGGFRGRYGRTKKNFAGGEEIVAAALIHQLGYTIAILPEAEVEHIPAADRYSRDYVRRTIISGLFTIYQEQKDLYLPRDITARTCIASILKLTLRAFFNREKSQSRIIEDRIRILAYFQLILQMMKDSFWRLRQPITQRKSCPKI
jgi:glycosyltransferase involved in cell wall biosynthesis